jgi:endonuclease/exonuclease/phosphatase (EEP) superfamily protein YafD
VAGAVAGLFTALLLAALLGLTVAGRAWRAPPAVVVVAVIFLPWLYAGLATLAFAVWAAVPDRRLPPIVMAWTVVVALGLWGPSWSARPEVAEGEAARVMSWNVRRLWGGEADGGDPLGCVAEAVEAADPDVLALMEVSARDVAALSVRLGLTCVHTAYHGGDDPTIGGLAACARGPRWSLRSGAPRRYVDDDEWRYVFAEFASGEAVFNLLAVHLYPYGISAKRLQRGLGALAAGEPGPIAQIGRGGEDVVRAQSAQAAALLERVSRFRDPTVLAGDFNSTRDFALHASLRGSLTDTWERAGRGLGASVLAFGRIPLRVDYVYASPALAVAGASSPGVGCSDHRPVVSELVLRGGAKGK